MIILGIDLSLTSPALCLSKAPEFAFDDCKFFFLTQKEKFLYKHNHLHGEMFLNHQSDSERYHNISQWIVDICKSQEVSKAFIEGYSFGSTGRVFQIAENGGVLKYELWKNHIEYEVVPPTVIKKFAVGKGNANKEQLQDRFFEETKFNVKAVLGMTDKQWNPSSDIIDSYYICKYGKHHEANCSGNKNIQ